MAPKKGQPKSASAAKQPTANIDETEPPSATDSPTTPRKEQHTAYSFDVPPTTNLTAIQQTAIVGNLNPIIPAHNSRQAARRSAHGNAELAPQARQPLDMFGRHRSGYEDALNPAMSATLDSAPPSAHHPFTPLAQRCDQTQNFQNHPTQNIQSHQAPRIRNYQPQNIQAQYNQTYLVSPSRGNSEQYSQSAYLDPRSQQCEISLEHNDTGHGTKYRHAIYSSDGTYLGPKNLPGVNTSSSCTAFYPSSGHANTSHAGDGRFEAMGPATQAIDVPKPAEFETYGQISQELQDRVDILVQQSGRAEYGGYILSEHDAIGYEQAVWNAKTRGKKGFDQKCGDYPWDEAGQREARQRLFEAIVNLDGPQDIVSDNGVFLTSIAVKTVRSISSVEVELVVNRLMVAMREAQSGIPVAPPDVKIVQEDTFSDKLNAVVEVLSINKGLCRGVINHIEDVAKVAADPAGELNKKRRNHNNNKTKSLVLSAANQKKGTSRKFKGKGKGKGQGKGPADAEAEAEVEAEAEPASSAEAVDQEGRPSKRRRTDDYSMTASSNDEAFTGSLQSLED